MILAPRIAHHSTLAAGRTQISRFLEHRAMATLSSIFHPDASTPSHRKDSTTFIPVSHYHAKRSLVSRSLTRLEHSGSKKDFDSIAPEAIAKEEAEGILKEFSKHRAHNHQLFKYLAELRMGGKGMTPMQYAIIRDNFFYRTANTIISAAKHAAKAVQNHDYKALAESAKNISDEGGNGDPEGVHLQLLEDCFNIHAAIVFGIPEATIPGSEASPFLTKAVREFRKMQHKIFRSSYATMTGCLLAHEDAADQMLINLRKYVFEQYRGYYTEGEFKELMRYFDAHRDDTKPGGNVEEQHKEKALEVASGVILRDPKSSKLILQGGLRFLDAQSRLWDEMLQALIKARHFGTPVPLKSEPLAEDHRPPLFTHAREVARSLSFESESKSRSS